jgi:hypothetical protein
LRSITAIQRSTRSAAPPTRFAVIPFATPPPRYYEFLNVSVALSASHDEHIRDPLSL